MKRHLSSDEGDESRFKARRISHSEDKEEKEDAGSLLDLNATPRGFDLNAPIAEEESSHGQSGWLPAQDEYDRKEDPTGSQLLEAGREPQSPAPVAVETETQHTNSEDSASSNVALEPDGSFPERETEDARVEPEESHDEPEPSALPDPTPVVSVLSSAIFQRTLEPPSVLNIDDDLDIIRSAWSAQQQKDLDSLDNVLFEACEELARAPSNPSRYHYMSMLYISKKLPEAFGLPKTAKALVGFLRNTTATQPIGKRQMILPILASKLLLRAFLVESEWPLEFVQIYLEDATVYRSWIDNEGCKEFVANILTAFPEADMVSPSADDSTHSKASEYPGTTGDLVHGQSAIKGDSGSSQLQGTVPAKNRYPSEETRARVRGEFLQALDQLLGSAASRDNPRQLLRLLMQGVGYGEVRVVASSMLEGYLNNPVHVRAAKALLDRILQHTHGTSDSDLTIINNLLTLRITSMQLATQTKSAHGNIFADMVTLLVKRRPEYATFALKTYVTAEISSRNPHNFKSIITVLKAMQESPPPEYELALILQELAASDDYRPQLRDLLHRMMKQVGPDIDVHALCHGLMQPWPAMGEQHEGLKEAWLKQLVDLSCQLLLHAAVPYALDENLVSVITSTSAVSGVANLHFKEKLKQLEKFIMDTASFQVEAVAWCTDVLAVYLPSMDEIHFTRVVRQLLFLEGLEVYYGSSENVSEVELLCFRLLSSCLPAPEEILARLILMAISNYPVSQFEALKLIERVVWRAATLKRHFDGALTAASVQLPPAILKLASFNVPGVTRQPLAQLVVKDMYWRACFIVLIIAAYNPSTIGLFVWENLPTIRCLMEALLTCTHTFLPIGVDAVRFSEVKRLEQEAEHRDRKAEEAISAFLDVQEKKRNDPSSADVDGPGSSTSSPASRLTSQGGDWKGKVMFLDQAGPVRRPPRSAVDELDRVDTTYQLGHFLRRSRSPDFFEEITKQTLHQAWPWLQKILVKAPDMISYLPPVWQCELLFMVEGQHPSTRNLSLNVGELSVHLQNVMAQQVHTKEGEIESIVNFLAQKLVVKNNIVRLRARRCFSYLFDELSYCTSDQTPLPPSSPPDNKRMELPAATVTHVVLQSKNAANPASSDITSGSMKKIMGLSTSNSHGLTTTAPAFQPSPANLSNIAGCYWRVSPGGGQVSASQHASQESITSTEALRTEDSCGWLESLQRLTTSSRVVNILVPAIHKAVERENSIPVVKAYFEFLKKHSSRTSLACVLANFVLRGKLMVSSLLLGPSSSSGPVNFSGTTELILESFTEALRSGITIERQWDEHASLVALVVPHVATGSKEYTLSKVKVPKIVVDAALEVLSLLSREHIEDKNIDLQFQQLLNIFFPHANDLDRNQKAHVDVQKGWLEGSNGKIPLLSELQAKNLVQSKNMRLVRAGLSVLTLDSKLEVFEGFGLSPEGAMALLSDLCRLKDTKLEEMSRSKRFSGRWMKIKYCVETIVNAESTADASLLRMLEQLSSPSSAGQPPSKLQESHQQQSKVLAAGPIGIARPFMSSNQNGEEIASYVCELLISSSKGEDPQDLIKFSGVHRRYVQLRQCLQAALINNEDEGSSLCLKKLLGTAENAEGDKAVDSKALLYSLPILALISQHSSGVLSESLEALDSVPTHARVPATWTDKSLAISSLPGSKLEGNSTQDYRVQEISTPASVFIETVQQKLANIYGASEATVPENLLSTPNIGHVRTRKHARGPKGIESQYASVVGGKVFLQSLEVASVDKIESLLRRFLYQKFPLIRQANTVPVNGSVSKSLSLPDFLENLLGLLKTWTLREEPFGAPLKPFSQKSRGDGVEKSGRCALVMETLELLDPEFQSKGLLKCILEISQAKEVSGNPFRSSAALIALSHVGHRTSWDALSSVFRIVLGADHSKSVQPFKDHVQEMKDCGQSLGNASFSTSEEAEAVIEFIALCVQHPRAKLALHPSDESPNAKLMWSWLDPLAACKITKHAVSACVAASLENRAEAVNVRSRGFETQPHVNGVEPQVFRQQNRALKVLLLACSQGSHIMRAIIHQLLSFQEDTSGDGFTPGTKEVSESFLWRLYLAFPVSVKAVLNSSNNKLFLAEDRSANPRHYLQGQTFSLNTIVHSALQSVCCGSEKEASAAYGFCQDLARQHPLLVIPHLSTLTLLLKQLIPLPKQGDPQARSTAVRALSMGIGLLDALRPHVIVVSNSKHTDSEIRFPGYGQSYEKAEQNMKQARRFDFAEPATDLEAMLDIYFEVLHGVDVQDRSMLAKIVARFSDFLCHCVATGGRICEYVAARRTPFIETTAQKFPKLKKLGYLLNLLDTLEQTQQTEMLPSDITLPYPPPAFSSSIVVSDILKVRTQLQQCIKLQTMDTWREQGLAFYSPGKSFQVSQMGGDNLEGNDLSATLNDLERASARMPAILSILEDSLVQLTLVKDGPIRERIYNLLERSLLYCPSEESSSNIVGGLLRQLRSSSIRQAKAASRNASRFFYFSPGMQESILVEMLQLGKLASDDLQQLLQGLFSVTKHPIDVT